jgi:hypothetical protein
MFIERGFEWCKPSGFNSMVTIQSWMFLSSFESMRTKLLSKNSIFSLIHIGYNSFPELNSKVVQCAAFVFGNHLNSQLRGRYVNLNAAPQSADKKIAFEQRDSSIIYDVDQSSLLEIPGSALAYWANKVALDHFKSTELLGKIADLRSGISTGDNDVFYRSWFEVSVSQTNFSPDKNSGGKWFPIVSGGYLRR